jgi:uncharacterized membrane protein YbhN (UPF0104 family)
MRAQPLDRTGLERRWAALAFVDGWDRTWRRRPSDIARVLVGILLTILLSALVHLAHPLFAPHWTLPTALGFVLLTIAWLGLGLPTVVLLLVSVLRARWLVPLSALVSAAAGAGLMVWLRPSWSGHVPLIWAAAVWAGLMALWPLTRNAAHRWYATGVTAWGTVLVCSGQASVADLLQALAVGFTVGSLARLVTGTVAVDRLAAVYAVAEDLGVELADVQPTSGPTEPTRFDAVTTGGRPVVVNFYSRDYTQAQAWKGVLRFVWYRGSTAPPTANRLQYLEHHLAVLGQARSTGATELEVIACGLGGPTSDALLVTAGPTDATTLAALGDSTTPADLAGAWGCLAALHASGLAHRGLTGTTIGRTSAGRWVVEDLRRASIAATDDDMASDRAALLAATARQVGVPGAVEAAHAALGPDDLATVLPLLQPRALPAATKEERKDDKTRLPELRSAASEAAGVPPPDLAKLVRVSPVDLGMVAGTLLGLWILVGELANVGDIGDTLKGAIWGWLALAFVVGLLPNLTEASALAGAVVEPLPFRPLVGLKLADGFLGLIAGTVATTAASIRFFQLRGLAASIAVTSGLLYSLTGFADQMILSAIAFFPARDSLTVSPTEATSSSGGSSTLHTLLIIGVAVLVVLGIALAVPRVRRLAAAKILPQLSAAKDNLRALASRPAKLVQLFGSNAMSQLLYALCLGLCLWGFGGSTSFAVLILVNTASALLGGIAPIPGGMGVVEAGLIAGLTAAGVPQDQAIAATFAYRLITAYLPPIWGWPAMVWLRRADYL